MTAPRREHETSARLCVCDKPIRDEFLCRDCAGQLASDLTWLGNALPDLVVMLTRQAKTSRLQSKPEPEPVTAAAKVVAPQLRTASGPISLVATPSVFDVTAADTLGEVRGALLSWARHLCEARGLVLADELGKVAA